MTKQEILASLENYSENFPKEALREAQSKRIELTTELLESLDYANNKVKELREEDSDYYLHTYAMYLLAEFREKRAFSKLIAFLRQPEEYIDFLLGETLTEDFPCLLCSTFDGENLNLLTDVIENHELYEYARSAALSAYVFLYEEGFITQEEIISYFRFLIHDNKITDDFSLTADFVVCIIRAKLTQLIPDVCFLYDNECVATYICGDYDSFIDSILLDKYYREEMHYIDDAVLEMEKWACFKHEYINGDRDSEKFSTKGLGESIQAGTTKDMNLKQQPVKKAKKVGRNDPCPCGSGKKYKKCCYDKDQREDSVAPIRLEDKYDLLKDYPKDSPLFKTLFNNEEAIEIDIPVYKALHHRAIPLWVKRDFDQERLGQIHYLNEALELFLKKCRREHIASFAAYDEQYMVHYRSSQWVEALIELLEDDMSPEMENIREKAMKTMETFAGS